MTDITQQEFQAFLDAISDCFTVPDFGGWRDRIELPFSLITSVGATTLNTDSELETNFNQYLKVCDLLSLDRIYRLPISLEDCKDGTWIGTYETHLMSGDIRPTRPYTSSVLLIRTPSGLKMTAILNARGTHEWNTKPT